MMYLFAAVSITNLAFAALYACDTQKDSEYRCLTRAGGSDNSRYLARTCGERQACENFILIVINKSAVFYIDADSAVGLFFIVFALTLLSCGSFGKPTISISLRIAVSEFIAEGTIETSDEKEFDK